MSCQRSKTKIDSAGTLLSPAEAQVCIQETCSRESERPLQQRVSAARIKMLSGRVQGRVGQAAAGAGGGRDAESVLISS